CDQTEGSPDEATNLWSAGITSRPAWGPCWIWIPCPGPIAYQPQGVDGNVLPGGVPGPRTLTLDVISLGADQVRPSSVLSITRTWLVSRLNRKKIWPVAASTTGEPILI